MLFLVYYALYIYYTLYSLRHANRLQDKAGKRLTCIRVSVALVLLAIVLVFGLLQWYEWWPDPDGLHNAGTNIMNISMEYDDHHHHTTVEEDDKHHDDDHHGDDDHDDEHHDDDHHQHQHTALYHHAVVLTASGLDCFSLFQDLCSFRTTFLDELASHCFNEVVLCS